MENIVRNSIIYKWESQDEPEHLKTIRDRLLRNETLKSRLLGLYQKVLQAETSPTNFPPILADDSNEQVELKLAGLVIKGGSHIRIKKPHLSRSI